MFVNIDGVFYDVDLIPNSDCYTLKADYMNFKGIDQWEITLDKLKSTKKQEINQAREQARLDEGAEYDNDLFDIDEKSQANITAIVSMLIANNIPDTYKSVYRSKTNNNHELTKVQMVELGTVIGAKVSEIYQKSWTLKEQVNKATTKEEVEVIKWNM